jgi:hypothetical protein
VVPVKLCCLQIRRQKAAGEWGRAERRRFKALGVGGLLVLDAGLFAQQQRSPQIARGVAFVQNGARGRVPANHVWQTPRVSITPSYDFSFSTTGPMKVFFTDTASGLLIMQPHALNYVTLLDIEWTPTFYSHFRALICSVLICDNFRYRAHTFKMKRRRILMRIAANGSFYTW